MITRAPALTSLLERPAAERRIGPFLLVEELGAGGYAPVWLAREMYGWTEVRLAAVKLFALDAFGADKEDIIEEARALGRVEHPHVARFYALAIDEPAGVMGLAMELLRGRSLENRLATEKKLSIEETLPIGITIASALAAVHQAGIVHRDVKPSNIVEEAQGTYKLIDFGIARASNNDIDAASAESVSDVLSGPTAGAATAQVPGIATGTPGYIDPACFGGRAPSSIASDVYGLGATLYRCLSGMLPGQLDSPVQGAVMLDSRVLTGENAPISIALRAPGVPPLLAQLIDQMLAPRPENRPRGAAHVQHVLEQIRLELGGRKRALPPENEGPFRGLHRFEAQDRDVFFGRRNEIAAAITLLRGRGLVALVGPSGSGKSSLARAAILPEIADGALAKWPKTWDVAIVEPGRDPSAAIAIALEPFVPEASLLEPSQLVAALAERAATQDRGVVLFVDQLEELVTTAAPESRLATAEILVAMGAQAIPGVRAVVAARSDLLDPLLAIDRLGKTIARGICLVDPLRPLDWRDNVELALGAYGYKLQDQALEEELFQAIDRAADAMPLVEFALTELWNARDRQNKRLTRAALERVGGIEGALERHAEATIAAMEKTHPTSVDVVRAVLLALTTPEGTRRAQSELELVQIAGDSAREVIAKLTKARLVVPSKEGVTVAHEALLTRWRRLRSWIAEARDNRMLAEEIERDAARWEKDPESVGLWASRRLGFARDLVRNREVRLSARATEFVQASARASQRQNALAVLVGTTFLAVLAGAGVMYVQAQRDVVRAQRARLEAERVFIERIEDVVRNSKDKDSKLEELGMLLDGRKKEEPRASPVKKDLAPVLAAVPSAHAAKFTTNTRVATTPSAVVSIAPSPMLTARQPPPAPDRAPTVAPTPALTPAAAPTLVPAVMPPKPNDLATVPSREF